VAEGMALIFDFFGFWITDCSVNRLQQEYLQPHVVDFLFFWFFGSPIAA
jgi:hypothetical protein